MGLPTGSDEPGAGYQYADLKPSEIRILRLLPASAPQKEKDKDGPVVDKEIRCELRHVSLDDETLYEALSYVWGKPLKTCEITVSSDGDRKMGVTENLYSALTRLRQGAFARDLWIDQLCINQENPAERSRQVQLMRQIYQKAKKTVVWLGDYDKDATLLFEIYQKLTVKGPKKEDGAAGDRAISLWALWSLIDLQGPFPELALPSREVLERFLSRAWFRRAWVYQEAVVAKEVDVLMGRLTLPFEFVAELIKWVYSLIKSEEGGEWVKRIKQTQGFGPLRSIHADRQSFRNQEPLDFLHILWRARKYLQATDHRDLVYSFLGISNVDANELSPDYTVPMGDPKYPSAVEDAYIKLARSLIRVSDTLEIFQCVVPTRRSKYRLPSWVPDWSESRFKSGAAIMAPGMTRKFNACRGRGHTWAPTAPGALQVKGHIIGTVASVLEHTCEHSSFSFTLKEALRLHDLVDSASAELSKLRQEGQGQAGARQREYDDLRAVLLRTILADGTFALQQPIEHPISELLKVYDADDESSDFNKDPNKQMLHRYLRETGNIAKGKGIFLTGSLDIGLGYSTMKQNDVICILYGSKAPCVLRRAPRLGPGCYILIGHCYLDGWMYGDNPRDWKWWEETAEAVIIV